MRQDRAVQRPWRPLRGGPEVVRRPGAAARVAGASRLGARAGAGVHDSLQAGGEAHWNVLANSTSSTSMIIDLAQDFSRSPGFAQLSTALQRLLLLLQASPLGTRITLNVDQWDGFPLRREALFRSLRRLGNVVLIAGDIHSSWVTDHSAGGRPLFELTGPAISPPPASAASSSTPSPPRRRSCAPIGS
ncbi:MAG: alkaline phosphatase D family protein [Rhodospirillales bacterium]|nr:alkaline phosphatase D family protein [Rhodospirillales bacterium]